MLGKQREGAGMPFIVSASNQMGSVSWPRDTLNEAVTKAAELQNNGYEAVTITDPTGQLVEDTELERLFNERK